MMDTRRPLRSLSIPIESDRMKLDNKLTPYETIFETITPEYCRDPIERNYQTNCNLVK